MGSEMAILAARAQRTPRDGHLDVRCAFAERWHSLSADAFDSVTVYSLALAAHGSAAVDIASRVGGMLVHESDRIGRGDVLLGAG